MNTTSPLLAPSAPALAELPVASRAAAPAPVPADAHSAVDDAHLREALKRCSPATYEAARAFRATGDYSHLPAIVTGVIERFVERELRAKLAEPANDLRLIEDLGLDSLTMMEIVILTEDVLPVTINNEELRHLRTLGHVRLFIEHKLRGLPLPPELTAQPCTACAAKPAAPL
ncbi:MAG: phosphopantetheine-binding protein [Verrucomicrobia bacterium]|nr:phosphopantetheine-binding protein [Verrucomicrobiota bacterium]